MEALGRVIVETIVHEYGRDEVLRRLAHPFWFQAFGSVMGMDWHSSGVTTSVVGALKRGLEPVSEELGLYFCGGRGKHSRKTPEELVRVGERTGLDGDTLAQTSRLVAKVDSAAVQDGFELYLHSFIVGEDGKWTVVQQGMDGASKQARRYHWLSDDLEDYCETPHSAIDGPRRGKIVNLTDVRARASKVAQLELVAEGPDRVVATLRQLRASDQLALPMFESAALEPASRAAPSPEQAPLPYLQMPAHHEVRATDLVLRRLHGGLAAAAESGVDDFRDLLLTPGIGARTIAALALVSEVIYGAAHRFSDPARHSMALGGKDGHPFPVPLKVYDQTISTLRRGLERARLGNDDRLAALRRLDQQARALERTASGPGFEEFIAAERRHSAERGGRTVTSKVIEEP